MKCFPCIYDFFGENWSQPITQPTTIMRAVVQQTINEMHAAIRLATSDGEHSKQQKDVLFQSIASLEIYNSR